MKLSVVLATTVLALLSSLSQTTCAFSVASSTLTRSSPTLKLSTTPSSQQHHQPGITAPLSANHRSLPKVKTTVLKSTAIDTENSEQAFIRHIRKNRLLLTQSAAMLLYAAYGLFNLKMHAAKPSYSWLLASGHFLVAGMTGIVKKATKQDNLFLFTSKRYNLGLLFYGLCQLAVLALAKRVPGGNPIFGLGPLFLTLSALQGYVYGVRGYDYGKVSAGAMCDDFNTGAKQTLASMCKLPKKLTSFLYWAATLFAVVMMGDKMNQIVEIILARSSSGGSFGIIDTVSLLVPVFRLGRLALLTCVVYSLKDGADRGLLDAPSFTQLNFLASMSYAAMAAYVGATTNAMGGSMAFLSAVCAWNGVASLLKNSNKN